MLIHRRDALLKDRDDGANPPARCVQGKKMTRGTSRIRKRRTLKRAPESGTETAWWLNYIDERMKTSCAGERRGFSVNSATWQHPLLVSVSAVRPRLIN